MSSVVVSPSLYSSPIQIAVASYATCSDTDLVKGLVGNEPAAWQALVVRYGRLIQSCIHRVTARFPSVVRVEDGAEIMSMLYVQLLSNDRNKLKSFDPERGCKLGTWLGLLATHSAYDFLRSVRKVPRAVELTEAEELATETPDPSELTLRSERASSVAAVLSEFTHKDREFVDLYFGEGLDPDEVARRMGISVKTVYSKKHKIQRRLAGLLGGPRSPPDEPRPGAEAGTPAAGRLVVDEQRAPAVGLHGARRARAARRLRWGVQAGR